MFASGCSYDREPQATTDVIIKAIADGEITAAEAGNIIFNSADTNDIQDQKTVKSIQLYLGVLIGNQTIPVDENNLKLALSEVENFGFHAAAFYYLEREIKLKKSRSSELFALGSQRAFLNLVNHVEQPQLFEFEQNPLGQSSAGEKKAAELLLSRIGMNPVSQHIEQVILSARKVALIIKLNSVEEVPERSVPDLGQGKHNQLSI